MNVTAALERAPGSRSLVTLTLCLGIAVVEGMDLQSMGIAAPKLGPEFELSSQQLGYVLMASPVGLFFGAFLGGRLADAWGRKRALVLASALFGALQLSTAWAGGFWSLLVMRLLCGLGLGGAMPNLIALTAEASGGRNGILNVVITFAGMPTGGALASLIAFLAGAQGDWRLVFYVGGILPLLLAPVMALAMPESIAFRHARAALDSGRTQRLRAWQVLFGGGRALASVLLWIGLFCTTVVVYLLLSWLPLLMGAQGFSKTEALFIQILFNLGAAIGSVMLAWRMQRRHSVRLPLLSYAGVAAGLVMLARVGQGDLTVAATAATLVGAFLLGAQFILFGLTPAHYSVESRGTGTGAAVAASRLGSAAGPYLPGLLLGSGTSTAHVLQALLPVIAVAAAAAVCLVRFRPAQPLE
jgi:AAHS family 3-hydroxyphenylpropionic acid transporter